MRRYGFMRQKTWDRDALERVSRVVEEREGRRLFDRGALERIERIVEEREAEMGNHTVSVLRRRPSGGFVAIARGGSVRPGEAIRLFAQGIENQLFFAPKFTIAGIGGTFLEVRANANLAGEAWADVAAPTVPDGYDLLVEAQTSPFLPGTHIASTLFFVSEDAPEPIDKPPPSGPVEDTFRHLRGLGLIALGIVGLAAAGVFAARR